MSTNGVNFENFFKKIVGQATANKAQAPAENLQQTANNLRSNNNYNESGYVFNIHDQAKFEDGKGVDKNSFVSGLTAYGFSEENSNTIYNILNIDNEEGISSKEYETALEIFGQDTDAVEGNDIVDIEGIASKLEDYAKTMSDKGLNLDDFITQLGKDFPLAPYSKQGIINELVSTGLIDKDGNFTLNLKDEIGSLNPMISPFGISSTPQRPENNVTEGAQGTEESEEAQGNQESNGAEKTEETEENKEPQETYLEDGRKQETLEDGTVVTYDCEDAFVSEKDGEKTYTIDGQEVTEEEYNKRIQVTTKDLANGGKETEVVKDGVLVSQTTKERNKITEILYEAGKEARTSVKTLDNEDKVRMEEITEGDTTTKIEYDNNGEVKSSRTTIKDSEGNVINELYIEDGKMIAAEISPDGKTRIEEEYEVDKEGNKTLKYTKTITNHDDGTNTEKIVYADGKEVVTNRNAQGEIESITEMVPLGNGEWQVVSKDKDGKVLDTDVITREEETTDPEEAGETEESTDSKEVDESEESADSEEADGTEESADSEEVDESESKTDDEETETGENELTEDEIFTQAKSDDGKLSATFENSKAKDKIQTDDDGNEYITVESWNSDGENGLDCVSRILSNIYGVSFDSPEGQVIYKALCEANPDTMDPNNPDLLIDGARINLVEFSDEAISSVQETENNDEEEPFEATTEESLEVDTEENDQEELTYTDSELEELKKEQFSEINKMVDDYNGNTGNFVKNNGEIFYDSNNDSTADMRFTENDDGSLMVDMDNDGDFDAHVKLKSDGYAGEITLKTSSGSDADVRYVRKGNEIFEDTDLENKNLMLIDSDKNGEYDTAVEFDNSNKVEKRHSLKDYDISVNDYFKGKTKDEEDDKKKVDKKQTETAEKTSKKQDSNTDESIEESNNVQTENNKEEKEKYTPTEEDMAILNSDTFSYDIANASDYVKMMKNNQVRDFATLINDIFDVYLGNNKNAQISYDNKNGNFTVCLEPDNDTAKSYAVFRSDEYEYKMGLIGNDAIAETIIKIDEDGKPQKITIRDMEIQTNDEGKEVGVSTGNWISYEVDPNNEDMVKVITKYGDTTIGYIIPKEKDEI